MISLVDYWDDRGSFGTPAYGDDATPVCGSALCESRKDHPMVSGYNPCLNGFDPLAGAPGLAANRQTGPLQVPAVEYYDNPTVDPSGSPPQLMRVRAVAVEKGYTAANGNANIACSATATGGCGTNNDDSCGTCDGYAARHHEWWTSTSARNFQGSAFDCMDVTGVVLSVVRPQCTFGSDRCAAPPPPS